MKHPYWGDRKVLCLVAFLWGGSSNPLRFVVVTSQRRTGESESEGSLVLERLVGLDGWSWLNRVGLHLADSGAGGLDWTIRNGTVSFGSSGGVGGSRICSLASLAPLCISLPASLLSLTPSPSIL